MDTKFLRVMFSGLARFESECAELDLAERITTLVGPNGSGKSTLIESVAELFTFLSEYRVSGPVANVRSRIGIKRAAEPNWKEATITLAVDAAAVKPEKQIAEHLGDQFQEIRLVVVRLGGQFALKSVTAGDRTLAFQDKTIPELVDERRRAELVTERNELIKQRDLSQAKLSALENAVSQAVSVKDKAAAKKSFAEYESHHQSLTTRSQSRLPGLEEQIRKGEKSDYLFDQGIQVNRGVFDSFLQRLGLPSIIYINGLETLERSFDKLKEELRIASRKYGSHKATSEFRRLLLDIGEFLNTTVDTEGDDATFRILVAKRPVNHISMGTAIGLGFYGLVRQAHSNALVIWDEPENSLHTTRRNKIRSLMLKDRHRFLIATHQSEFAPVFEKSCVVYKLRSQFDDDQHHSICSVSPVNDLSGAFSILESLGMEPAKVLFTSNVVIWVEGPSDASYWRLWLEEKSKRKGLGLVEGFDYTFLFTGGALLGQQTLEPDLANVNLETLVNVLCVCPCSVFIADTDLDPKVVGKIIRRAIDNDARAFAHTYGSKYFQMLQDKGEAEAGLSFLSEVGMSPDSDFLSIFLKPRVTKIAQAIERARQGGNRSELILTFGRETENNISDSSFGEVMAHIYGVSDADAAELAALNAISVNRWESFDESIRNVVEGHPTAAKLLNCDLSPKLLNGHFFEKKVGFAQAYCDYYRSRGFEFSKLNDGGASVERVISTILEVRSSYNL